MQCCEVVVSSVAQSYLTLRDTMDWSPPGSSVHGISQARILEWVAISFSRGPIERTQGLNPSLCASCTGKRILYHEVPPGKPSQINTVNKSPLFFTPVTRRENKLARNLVRKFPLKKKKKDIGFILF